MFTKLRESALTQMFTRMFTALFTWKAFFWIANSVFMVVSMQHASYLFDGFNAPNTTLPLGIALVGVLDLAVILFIQALLVANERGEYRRAWGIISYIAVCALLSTIGNLVHNLHYMDTAKFTGVPSWLQIALPWIVSFPPLLIVAFSVVAELLVHTNAFRDMDIVEYQEQEDKKLAFKQVQLASRQKQAELNTLLLGVIALEKQNKKLRKGKQQEVTTQPATVTTQHATVTALPESSNQVTVTNADVIVTTQDVSKQSDGDSIVTDPQLVTPNQSKLVLVTAPNSDSNLVETKYDRVTRLLEQYPNMTHAEIAEKAGVSRGYVSQIRKQQSA